MHVKNNNDMDNIIRLKEIADLYITTKQIKKSKKYHEYIIKICDHHPRDEKMLIYKINSLKHLKKTYKTLEAIKELLKLNPHNLEGLTYIAKNENYNLKPVPIN